MCSHLRNEGSGRPHLLHEAPDETHAASFRFELDEANTVIGDGERSLASCDAQRHDDFFGATGECMMRFDEFSDDDAKRGGFIQSTRTGSTEYLSLMFSSRYSSGKLLKPADLTERHIETVRAHARSLFEDRL